MARHGSAEQISRDRQQTQIVPHTRHRFAGHVFIVHFRDNHHSNYSAVYKEPRGVRRADPLCENVFEDGDNRACAGRFVANDIVPAAVHLIIVITKAAESFLPSAFLLLEVRSEMLEVRNGFTHFE